MVVYDPRGHTWDSWCNLVAELFAPQQLGTVPEEKWRDWVQALSGIGYFMNSGVPDPRFFNTWKDWAVQFVGAMTVQS